MLQAVCGRSLDLATTELFKPRFEYNCFEPGKTNFEWCSPLFNSKTDFTLKKKNSYFKKIPSLIKLD